MIFLYIPDILHDVVFLHPQPLFGILSSLISISLPKTIDHLKSNSVIVNQKAYRELKDEGCLKDLLSPPLFNGFSHKFTADNFLHLMTSLFIMANLHEEHRYFLPSDLATTSSTDYKSIPSPFKEHVDPPILLWDMKPFPRGVFSALVVNFLYTT